MKGVGGLTVPRIVDVTFDPVRKVTSHRDVSIKGSVPGAGIAHLIVPILRVLLRGTFTEVFDFVICSIAVYMVHFGKRPSTVIEKPRHSMYRVHSVTKHETEISVPLNVSNGALPSSPAAAFSPE